MYRFACAFVFVLACSAQTFEVASVKPCRAERVAERKRAGASNGPGSLRLGCQTLMSLIQWAYVNYAGDRYDPLAATPISGGPAWINSELFEINSKPERAQSRAAMNGRMLRALLEERFRLRLHRETRSAPVYAMTAIPGRVKLTRAKEGACAPSDSDHPPQPEPGKPFPRICGFARVTDKGFDVEGATIANLCRQFSDNLDRPVVDRTGIAGLFDIHLDLSAEDLGHATPPPDPADVFVAVNRALGRIGLKLKPSQGPGEYIVIDGAEKPAAN